jgi:RNA polymerase sigma factor (sigma-70 family)
MPAAARIDPALIARARDGDAAALERLLGDARGGLRTVARRSCAAADVEDAVQEALWQASRKLGSLRTIAAFGGWLARIVLRACRRLLLRRRETVPLAEDSAVQDPVPVELRRDLIRALQSLPPPYREAIILRDVRELSAAEAAEQLGITVEALKSRLHRARAMMRERLDASSYW